MLKVNSPRISILSVKSIQLMTINLTAVLFILSIMGCSGSSEDASIFEITFENISSTPSFRAQDGSQVVTVFSSMIGVVHTGSNIFSAVGAPDQGRGLAGLAENGEASSLNQTLRVDPNVEIIGIGDQPSTGDAGILAPGQSFKLILSTIDPGSRLSITSSFLQGNDIVVMTKPEGIPLFDANGVLTSGDITKYFDFYDVGTEVNQAPGIGSNQVIRQGEAPAGQTSQGARENSPVRVLNDSFNYPSVSQSIRVTISPV